MWDKGERKNKTVDIQTVLFKNLKFIIFEKLYYTMRF